MKNISMVIGSWGSYNECNERALGSKWLDLGDYNDWEEIEEELRNEGFELEGIDEELFIQDIEGIDTKGMSGDNTHPKEFFELIQESEILKDDYRFEVLEAFLEIEDWSEFEYRVNEYGADWNDDIYLYKGYDWYDLGYELMHEFNEIPEALESYIDYTRYGEELGYDGFYQYDNGIIEIR